ncbi:MAG: acetyl-CoA carboxylase biotin carboxyl carrier protein [Bacteroidota bacterium]|nr:acetyl-CoA carboxylase biotin carboxyl carrier protein [Bacteroidota bacterium]
MDIKEIENLIRFVSSQKNVGEVEIEKKDFKLVIRKPSQQVISAPQYIQAQVAAPAQQAALPAATSTEQTSAPVITSTTPAAESSNLITIKSPMIGTFYRSSSPDKPSFVNVGDEIKVGKPVCIIEAMKLFNEIESEVSGKIVKVLVDNATPVEYDQPLFLVEPN